MWQHWNASVIDTIANSRTVEIGDINADGKLDFVVGAGNGSTTGAIAWYENTGALNFSKHSTDVPVNSSILTVRIGDLDQANGLDFVAVNYAQDAVYWLKNDGALNFSRESLPGTPPDAPTGLDLEDLNNDGYIDAVITNQFNRDHVYWYENDGSSSFTQHIAFDFLENDALHRVRAEFIDADGFRDLIVSQWGEDTDGIIHPDLFWLKNNGNGTFDPTNRVINPAGSPHSGHRKFVTSDIDDDGDADILITSRESGSAIWYENDGAGVFTENIIITRPEWTVTHSIIATDIDSDGDKDVIVTSDNLVALLENDGSEVFTFHEMYSENSSTSVSYTHLTLPTRS